jgi:hypothetical protein
VLLQLRVYSWCGFDLGADIYGTLSKHSVACKASARRYHRNSVPMAGNRFGKLRHEEERK